MQRHAINRACQLIEELGAGEVVGGMVDVYTKKKEPVRIPFEPERINALLGTDVSEEEMLAYFKKIDLGYDAEKTTRSLHRPSVMTCSARLIWLRRLPVSTAMTTFRPPCRKESLPLGKLPFEVRIEGIARDVAEFCGFSEGMNYSFESPKVFDKLADSGRQRASETDCDFQPSG